MTVDTFAPTFGGLPFEGQTEQPSNTRAYTWQGCVYLIRDVRHSNGRPCQYAIIEGDKLIWKPCIEGVWFADIEPLVRLTDG